MLQKCPLQAHAGNNLIVLIRRAWIHGSNMHRICTFIRHGFDETEISSPDVQKKRGESIARKIAVKSTNFAIIRSENALQELEDTQ
jgi:hypothetical protein